MGQPLADERTRALLAAISELLVSCLLMFVCFFSTVNVRRWCQNVIQSAKKCSVASDLG